MALNKEKVQTVVQTLMAENSHDTSRGFSRSRMAGLADRQYDGARDVYEEAGYPESLSFNDYEDLYERSGIAKRVVDIFPKQTWGETPELKQPKKASESVFDEFKEQWRSVKDKHGLWQTFRRFDISQRLGEFGLLVIGVADGADDMDQPVNDSALSGPEDLVFLRPVHQGNADVNSVVEDPGSERFGLPETYTVDLIGGMSDDPTGSLEIHWSRVIHAAEGRLENDVYGMPALHPIYNRLKDLQKLPAAAGEMFWKNSRMMTVLSNKEGYKIDKTDREDFDGEMEDLYHSLKQWAVFDGAEVDSLSPAIESPGDTFDMIMTMIAAGKDIPKRIFMGAEAGELASSQDERQFLKAVDDRRSTFGEHQIVRPFVDRLQDFGVLTQVEYNVDWPDLFQLTELEEAQKSGEMASAALAISKAQLNSDLIGEDFAREVLGDEISDDEVANALMEMADKQTMEMSENSFPRNGNE